MTSWQNLLQDENERVVLPYVGDRRLHSRTQLWALRGPRPRQYGWYTFKIRGRNVEVEGPAEAPEGVLSYKISGYLMGDRFAPDAWALGPSIDGIHKLERVHLVPPGIERFTRVTTGRTWMCGELIFDSFAMPLGPEPEVLGAFLNRKPLLGIKYITPSLEAAFLLECFQRDQAEAARAELERRRAEEEAKRQLEEKRATIAKQLGDGAGRREIARVDFVTAARAALAVGGAVLLDWRIGLTRHEYVVTYQVDDERLQCVVDETMHVIDAGVCLTDHATGRKGDQLFTLESLPAVIRQAMREGKLVVWRHA